MTKKADPFQNLLDDIHKESGDESLRVGIISGGIKKCSVISTRCFSLDVALGVGGVPKGRVVEIFGPEGSGKTTLALTIVAMEQAAGGRAAYIDAEHAIDPQYAQNIGVNLDEILFSQPDNGEQAIRVCEKLVQSGMVGVIVVDSVPSMIPQAELEGDFDEHHIGAQARLITKALRRMTPMVSKSQVCLIFINQLRDKIGVNMPGASKETTPGGRALRFYASVRMDIRRIGALTEGSSSNRLITGNKTCVKVIKNKVAPPFKQAEFAIIFGTGISEAGSILDNATKYKIISKSGSWYSYKDAKIGNGWTEAVEFLEHNKDIMRELDSILREKFLSKPTDKDISEDTGEDIGEDTGEDIGEVEDLQEEE